MKIKRLGLILLVMWLLPVFAYADVFLFPSDLTIIEDEAFAGNEGLISLFLPDQLSSIGKRAFYGCRNLRFVIMPSSLANIGEDAFYGCAEALYFQCEAGSEARDWVASSGFDYSAGTVCRALVIGQTYTGTDYALQGPANDIRAMKSYLERLDITQYHVTAKSNLTADGILSAISTFLAVASADDISLFYFSGHGKNDGSLLGADLNGLSPSRLRAALDAVPGRKVVIVDACHSGFLLEEPGRTRSGTVKATNKRDSNSLLQFNSTFLHAFNTRLRGSEFTVGGYYVITSCRAVEESGENHINGINGGGV